MSGPPGPARARREDKMAAMLTSHGARDPLHRRARQRVRADAGGMEEAGESDACSADVPDRHTAFRSTRPRWRRTATGSGSKSSPTLDAELKQTLKAAYGRLTTLQSPRSTPPTSEREEKLARERPCTPGSFSIRRRRRGRARRATGPVALDEAGLVVDPLDRARPTGRTAHADGHRRAPAGAGREAGDGRRRRPAASREPARASPSQRTRCRRGRLQHPAGGPDHRGAAHGPRRASGSTSPLFEPPDQLLATILTKKQYAAVRRQLRRVRAR